MQNINWKNVYEKARISSFEEFMESVNKINKIEESAPMQKFIGYMDNYEKKILPSLLEGANVTASKFVQIVVNEVKKNKKLMDAFIANPSSMFASILAGAEIGLVPSELLGEFYLIPRNLKQEDNSYKLTVTPLIGYKGLVRILLRSGEIENIEAYVVYNGDKFSVSYGTAPKLEHKPKFDVERTAENITHIYCCAHYKSGKITFQVMTKAELVAVQKMSKYNNELYFNDVKNPNRWMEKKACLIQLSKLLDKDYYGTKAIELDARIEGGAMITLDNNEQVKLIEGAPIKPTRFRNIYGTLNNLPNS